MKVGRERQLRTLKMSKIDIYKRLFLEEAFNMRSKMSRKWEKVNAAKTSAAQREE